MKEIVVICSGNTCRSPMAEGLIRARLANEQLADKIQVASAGVDVTKGEPASQHGIDLLAARGISLHAHRSRRLQLAEFKDADLVLVMTSVHYNNVRALASPEMGSNNIVDKGLEPAQMHKVLLFSQLLSASSKHDGDASLFDIADPYGQSKEVYLATLLQLEEILAGGWSRLLALCGEQEFHSSVK